MAKKEKVKTENAEPAGDKFVRLATLRVNKALKAISLIGNLSGAGYAYSPEQIVKITNSLKSEVANVEARFKGTGGKTAFTL